MMPDPMKYALIMLAAGIGVPVLAALNAQLGARIGSPAAAGAVMFLIAGTAAVLVAAAFGQTSAFALIAGQP
ncbi:MAG: DMT family transporter, partial [Roseinatronobacter sp.]